MNELDKLQNISEVSGNAKLFLLKQYSDDVKLHQLIDAALNYRRRYYIAKFNLKTNSPTTSVDRHAEFMTILATLESQSIRGDQAKSMLEFFLNTCNEQQKSWYSRIVRRDLKAGFDVSSANKCGYNIPTFEVMLAKDAKKLKTLDKTVLQGGFASPKMDGYRCLAEVIDGKVTLYSRNGTVYTNFQKTESNLSKCFPVGKHIFDGEIMSDDFQSMQKSAFASKRGTFVGDEKYHIFDYIPFNEWETKIFTTIKSERDRQLKNIFSNIDRSCNFVLVEQKYVNTVNALLEAEINFINMGYEGAMFASDVPYMADRSNNLLKFKTFQSQDTKIIGFLEGEQGSRLQNTLGCMAVIQENGLQCNVGSGFSDEDRKYIWDNQEEFLGRIIEVKYQELSKDGVMRFPVFIRFRDDK